MSNRVLNLARGRLVLPYNPTELLEAWDALRNIAIRHVPPAFSRDEWAYVISFLDAKHLWEVLENAFGQRCAPGESAPRVYSPRGQIALWLPNNVSLLGPLMLVLMSLSGNRVRLKVGSRGDDLTSAFLHFINEAQPDGVLARHLQDFVQHESFSRDDPKNAQMALDAQVRIIFGGDEAAREIDALPHPVHSCVLPFTDRRSEAWLDPACVDDAVLTSLIRVFTIYGQAGCTSPSRVRLLGADEAAIRDLRAQLLAAWPKAVKGPVDPHIASSNVMARQWAAGVGWDAQLAPNSGAVLATGKGTPINSPRFLPLVGGSHAQAFEELPDNIQTIGHALPATMSDAFICGLADAGVKRFVPLASMHHFGAVWDGFEFWRQLFDCMELRA